MKIRDVLAENFAALRAKNRALSRLPDIVKAGGGTNGTLGRIPLKTTGVSIDALEPLARVYGIEPWQLLAEGLGADKPVVAATEVQAAPLTSGGQLQALYDMIPQGATEKEAAYNACFTVLMDALRKSQSVASPPTPGKAQAQSPEKRHA